MKRVVADPCPNGERLGKEPMIVAIVVENRLNVFCEPAVSLAFDPCGRAVVGSEGVGVRKPRTEIAFCGKGVDEVAHDGVAHAVPDEDDGELAEELGDEPRCPPFREVRPPEIGGGKNEIRAVLPGEDLSVKVHQARPVVRFRDGELWSRVDTPLVHPCQDEAVVEVGRDEAASTDHPGKGKERLVHDEFTAPSLRE